MLDPRRHPEFRVLRRIVWAFGRSPDGLPSAHLQADTDWLTALRASVGALLVEIEAAAGLKAAANLTMR